MDEFDELVGRKHSLLEEINQLHARIADLESEHDEVAGQVAAIVEETQGKLDYGS